MQEAYTKKRFRPEWRLTLLVFILFPLMVSLGFWQLDRADQKRNLQALYTTRESAPPMDLAALPEGDIRYLNIRSSGKFEPDHWFLIENRRVKGRLGYEVIAVWRTASGRGYLVNLGWVNAMPDVVQGLPGNDTESIRYVEGHIYIPEKNWFANNDYPLPVGWPKRLPLLDIGKMTASLDNIETGFLLRLSPDSASGYERVWEIAVTPPEKHTGYAIQWFAMASVLCLLYIKASFTLSIAAQENETDDKHS